MTHERITADDVQVGDRIARTRTEVFRLVERIDEGPVSRRLHFGREACPEPEPKTTPEGKHYCPGCWRRYGGDAPEASQIAIHGHGTMGSGNIRPRRTAKLWKVVA